MATLLLAAAGSALGGAVGGSFAGIGAMALGKAAGAIVGSALDQRLLGLGSAPVETGRVERFRVMGSSEGAPLARVFGRNRVAGQMIWSSRFLESVHSETRGRQGRRRRHGARVQLLGQPRHRALRGRGVADRPHLGRRAGGRADGADLPAAPGDRGPAARPADRGDRGRGAGLSRHGLRGLREPRPHALRQPHSAVQLRGLPPAARGSAGRAAAAGARRARRGAGAGMRRVCAGDRAGPLPARQGRQRRPERPQRSRASRISWLRSTSFRRSCRTRGRCRWWSPGSATTCAATAARCGRPSSRRARTARRCAGWCRGRGAAARAW